MRIAFILPFAGLSGGIRVIAIYAQKLRAKGHEVFIISQPPEQQPLRRKIKGLLRGQSWPVSEQSAPFAGLDDHHTILEKPRAVQKGDVPDADIVIATFWKTAYWVNDLPASKGAKCYFIQGHEIQPHFYESTAEETYRFPLHQITVSSWLKNIMKEQYEANGGDLVPNAVDLQTFTSPPRQKNQALTIGFIFAPASTKNSELAIEAVEKARITHPKIKALAFGAAKPTKTTPLPDWIEFHHDPAQQDIPALYAACDVWLFTSDEEGFGLPILEAMACRTPVIATKAGAAPDLITPQNGTLLAPAPDPFAKEIVRFAQMSEEDWQDLSLNAYETAHRYDWDDAVQLFEAALEKALAQ